jgi:tetrapyrrole methylase family protein / MazG family protein
MAINSSSSSAGITLLGLGPGDPQLLSRQAWQLLQDASEVYLRTRQHPVVAGLPPQLQIHSFDDLYDQLSSFDEVYAAIVQKVLALGRRPQGVIYAVPGHPMIAEATGPEIARLAHQEGLPVRVVEGMSFLGPVFSALGIDPFPNTVLVDALDIAMAHVPVFPPSTPAILAQLWSSAVASDVKLTLMTQYPDEHPVYLIHGAGSPQEIVEQVPLYAIDQNHEIGLLTALYVPPLDVAASFESFQEIIAHLRAPNGCPWDREQTHKSLRSHLLEETYEVLAALDSENVAGLQEELGDLLLQIVLHAQIAYEDGEFNMSDVLRGIYTKIVHRHPHVFGDSEVNTTQGVLQNWEKLKAEERAANGKAEASLLDGVSLAQPALVQAEQYQKRAARVGFDWPNIQGVIDKLKEEWAEVQAAEDAESRASEIGDLIFSVVNLARWHKVDAESALREANLRFHDRFAFIEAAARNQGKDISDLSASQMDELWEGAKAQSRGNRTD